MTKSQKGKKAWDNVFSAFHLDSVQDQAQVVVSHELASGNRGEGQRRKGQRSSPAPNSKAKTDGEGETLNGIRQPS